MITSWAFTTLVSPEMLTPTGETGTDTFLNVSTTEKDLTPADDRHAQHCALSMHVDTGSLTYLLCKAIIAAL